MPDKRKLFIVRSHTISQRSNKQAFFLKDLFDVETLYWDRDCDEPKTKEKDGVTIRYFRFKSRYDSWRVFFDLFVWNIYLFFFLLKNRFDIVQATNLDSLFPVLLVAKLKRKPIVYDVADVYGDSLNKGVPSFIRRFLTSFERFMMHFVDKVILADDCRIKQLGLSGKLMDKVLVLYNIPIVKEDIGLKRGRKGELNVFYAGLLANNRGIPYIVETLGGMEGVSLTLAGVGADERLSALLDSSPDNIVFLGKIDYADVLEHTRRADCLIAEYDPTVTNHIYASPNKLFESFVFRRPLISNAGTNVADILSKYKCGVIVKYGSPEDLRAAVSKLRDDLEFRHKLALNCQKAYITKYNWDVQRRLLFDAFESL